MLLIDFFKENLGTIAVGAVVLTIVVLLVLKLVKDKRAGKSGCSCGCSSCPMSRGCPGNKSEQ